MRQKLGVEHECQLRLSSLLPEFLATNHIGGRHIDIEIGALDRHRFPAYYDARGGILHVDEEIWRAAKFVHGPSDIQNGFGYSNYVLAHEFGHVCLHTADHNLKFASARNENGYRFFFEVDVEWQADIFAHQLLVPDFIAKRFVSAAEISEHCAVQIEVAAKRYDEAGKKRPLNPALLNWR